MAGLSQYQISALTTVPRATVQRWLQRDIPPWAPSQVTESWSVPDAGAYCYLLGIYLGDGHIVHRPPNSWTLKVSCDRQYEGIMRQVMEAIELTFPGRQARRWQASGGASDIVASTHPAVGRAFPQHGPGHKHQRSILLTDWELEYTRIYPAPLIRGLIHSDGCRSINRFRTRLPTGRIAEYSYVRYFFTNYSADIRAIFAEHCQLVGIRVTQPSPRNLAVSRRASVAILETLVGPKE